MENHKEKPPVPMPTGVDPIAARAEAERLMRELGIDGLEGEKGEAARELALRAAAYKLKSDVITPPTTLTASGYCRRCRHRPCECSKGKLDPRPPLGKVRREVVLNACRWGATDEECAQQAGISLQTLRKRMAFEPELADQMALLRSIPLLRARKKIVEELESDLGAAKWYMDRYDRSQKSDAESAGAAMAAGIGVGMSLSAAIEAARRTNGLPEAVPEPMIEAEAVPIAEKTA